jgi:uncharacterized membrane protein
MYGEVLGFKEGEATSTSYLPAAWQDGEPLELAIPDGAATEPAELTGIARDVNADGIIVGTVQDLALNRTLPVMWQDDGTATLLPTEPEGDGQSLYINASGVVAGSATHMVESEDGGSVRYLAPALWRDGELQFLDFPEDYPAPSTLDDPTIAVSIGGLSDDGVLLARFGTTGGGSIAYQAYLHDGAGWTRLATPSDDDTSVAFSALSPNGIVVGRVTTAASESVTVVWTDGSPQIIDLALLDLGDLSFDGPVAINSAGAILATATRADGALQGLVLTPE